MNSQTTAFRFLMYQALTLIKWKGIGSAIESNLDKARHIPKGVFFICAPTIFMGIGLALLITAPVLYFLELYRSYFMIYLILGIGFSAFALITNYIFEFVVVKKVKKINSKESNHQIKETLGHVFSPLIEQVKKEKNQFISAYK